MPSFHPDLLRHYMRCKVEVTIYLQGHDYKYKRDSRHIDIENYINQDITCYRFLNRSIQFNFALGLWFLDNY